MLYKLCKLGILTWPGSIAFMRHHIKLPDFTRRVFCSNIGASSESLVFNVIRDAPSTWKIFYQLTNVMRSGDKT